MHIFYIIKSRSHKFFVYLTMKYLCQESFNITHLRSSENQKQLMALFCHKTCSDKFRKIHRKAPVPGSLFNKVAGWALARVLSSEFCVISENTLVTEHLRTRKFRATLNYKQFLQNYKEFLLQWICSLGQLIQSLRLICSW